MSNLLNLVLECRRERKKGLDSQGKVFESWIETFVRSILSGAPYKQLRVVLHGAKELELCVYPALFLEGIAHLSPIFCFGSGLWLYIAYHF